MDQFLNIMPIPVGGVQKAPDLGVAVVGGNESVVGIDFRALLAQLALTGGVVADKTGAVALMPEIGRTITPVADKETPVQDTSDSIDPLVLLMDGLMAGSMPVSTTTPPASVVTNDSVTDLLLMSAPMKIPKPDASLLELITISSPTKQVSVSVDQLLAALQTKTPGNSLVVSPVEILPIGAAIVDSSTGLIPTDLRLNEPDLAKLQLLLTQVVKSTMPETKVEIAQPGENKIAPQILPTTEPAKMESLKTLLDQQFPSMKIESVKAELALYLAPTVSTKETITSNITNITHFTDVSSIPEFRSAAASFRKPLVIVQDPTVKTITAQPIAAEQVESEPLTRLPELRPEAPIAADTGVIKLKIGTTTKASSAPMEIAPNGNAAKIVIESTKDSNDPGQSASNWSKSWSNQEPSSETRVPLAPQLEQPDKPKFKIEFNRFQIDALLKRSEMRIQLQPSYLGTMRIKLVSTPQEMTARFETATETARAIVEQNLPQLRENLERVGIKVDHVEVVLSDQDSRQHQAQHHGRSKQGEAPAPNPDLTSDTELFGNSGGNSGGVLTLGNLNLLA